MARAGVFPWPGFFRMLMIIQARREGLREKSDTSPEE
jgi:hypothetical protein